MHLCTLTRWLRAASAIFLAAASAPVFGQTADLQVTLTLDGGPAPTAGTVNGGFTIGSPETYTVTVKNNGPNLVTDFTLDATIDAALTDVAVTGCEPVTAGTDFPCIVTVAGDLLSGATATVTIDATYPAPAPLSPGTATCPSGAVNVTSSVTVSNARQAGSAVNDPTAGNDTSTVANAKLRDWADLEVVNLEGPGNASEGQSLTYTTTVRNNGPCTAPNVRATLSPPSTLTYVDASASGDCTNPAAFGTANRCELGDLAKAATKTFSAVYSVNDFPSDITRAAIPLDAAVVSRNVAAATNPFKADDPNSENDSLSTSANVDLDDGGCSTGGAGTLFGLLALVALRLGWRRSR